MSELSDLGLPEVALLLLRAAMEAAAAGGGRDHDRAESRLRELGLLNQHGRPTGLGARVADRIAARTIEDLQRFLGGR